MSIKERPILFSAAMVRATLGGIKTQTRRVITPQPDVYTSRLGYEAFRWKHRVDVPLSFASETMAQFCPYGASGDRLWGRETFYAFGRWETRYSEEKKRDERHFIDMTIECGKSYRYAATDTPDTDDGDNGNQWHKRPSIYMPRAASRILREIVNVRVERLQDISEADAESEGTRELAMALPYSDNAMHRIAFSGLWNSINASRGYSWEINPWVWVVEYKAVVERIEEVSE